MSAYLLEIFVVVLGLLMLALEAFGGKASRDRLALLGIGGLGFVLICLLFFACCPSDDLNYWGVYYFDRWAAFFKGIALLTTMIVLVMAREFAPVLKFYTCKDEENSGLGEFYTLPVFACAGMMWMASARDLITIFVALEIVTMSFYVLVAYLRRNVGSLEAGVKYLILGALSTGFFIYGITWLFGVTGEFKLDAIAIALASDDLAVEPALFAFALIMVGLGFKIAAVPFQLWVPDVYQGAPLPVTAFLSVGSKAAGFIVLLRVVEPFLVSPQISGAVVVVIICIVCATLLYGNLAAIPQTNAKRLLAYSSIAHAGFLLMALPSIAHGTDLVGPGTWAAISFYLGGYLLMALLCFLILTIVSANDGHEDIEALCGLSKRSPLLAFALLVGVASLAGVPLTVGFFGKFFLFNIAIQDAMLTGFWLIVVLAVIGAAAGFYYYFKIIRAMYWDEPLDDVSDVLSVHLLTKVAIVVLVLAIILFGIYPKPILGLLG